MTTYVNIQLRTGVFRKLGVLVAASVVLLTSAGAQGARRWIVGVDRSASRTAQQMADMRQFIQGLGERLTFGDHIALVQMFQANTDLVRQVRDSTLPLRNPSTPTARERRQLESLQRTVRQRLAVSYTDTTGQKQVTSTDILGFLRRASDYARSGSRIPTTVVLLSDMLHSTSDLDMERRGGVKDAAWIEQQRKMGLIPDLRGICIAAVGGETSTPRGVSVQKFWIGYFRAAGAQFRVENYRQFMVASDISCSSVT